MTREVSVESVVEGLKNPQNYAPLVPNDEGRFAVRCVDKRFLWLGNVLRQPGNMIGRALVRAMHGEVPSVGAGVVSPEQQLIPGAHFNCAFDAGMHPIVQRIAERDHNVMGLTERILDKVLSNMKQSELRMVGNTSPDAVAAQAERVLPDLERHQPDTLQECITTLSGASVITPQPAKVAPVAFVFDARLDHVAPVPHAFDGTYYDTSVEIPMVTGRPEHLAATVAVAAATGLTVAENNGLAVVVAGAQDIDVFRRLG